MKKVNIILLILLATYSFGCKSTDKFESRNPEEIFNKAVEYYNDEKYLEAKNLFELFKYQYSATEWADDALYYLGEIAFQRKEYVIAAFSFNQLRRSYPGSSFAKLSLFKTAMSFNELSPKFDRDQEYTRKAIQAFQEFQYVYPDDSLYAEAGNKINELRSKLALREFSTAELYRKLDSPYSSLIYYNSVINDYNDTEYYEPAFFGKIEVLMLMEKYDEAKGTIEVYRKLFPRGKYISQVNVLATQIH